MATKYLLSLFPQDLVEITASNPESARNKYRKAFPQNENLELLIVPSSHAHKTSIDQIFPLYKCLITKVKQ